MKALEKWYGKAPVFEPLPKFAEEKRDLALVIQGHHLRTGRRVHLPGLLLCEGRNTL